MIWHKKHFRQIRLKVRKSIVVPVLALSVLGLIRVEAQAGPELILEDEIPIAIFAADDVYFYGFSDPPGRSQVARMTIEDRDIEHLHDFGKRITDIWTTSRQCELYAVVGQPSDLYRSTDCGNTFKQVLAIGDFPSGQVVDFRILHRGLAEVWINGSRRLLVGEYNVNKDRVSGGLYDQVRIFESTDGERWSTLYTHNVGAHHTRHIHVVAQDPRHEDGWIYFGYGDGTSEAAILAWDGAAPWPETSIPLAEFAEYSGFRVVSGRHRFVITDILFPETDPAHVYIAMELNSAPGKDVNDKGVWRLSRDLSTHERVYFDASEQGSGLRLGALTRRSTDGAEMQIWHDVGAIDSILSGEEPNAITFYFSAAGSAGFRSWHTEQLPLQSPGKHVPIGFFAHENLVYFSGKRTETVTQVYRLGGEDEPPPDPPDDPPDDPSSPCALVATDGEVMNLQADGQEVKLPSDWHTDVDLAQALDGYELWLYQWYGSSDPFALIQGTSNLDPGTRVKKIKCDALDSPEPPSEPPPTPSAPCALVATDGEVMTLQADGQEVKLPSDWHTRSGPSPRRLRTLALSVVRL